MCIRRVPMRESHVYVYYTCTNEGESCICVLGRKYRLSCEKWTANSMFRH